MHVGQLSLIPPGNILAEGSNSPLLWPSRDRLWVSFLRKQEPSISASPLAVERLARGVIPAQAAVQERNNWIPTFAGITYKGGRGRPRT